ncbi:MAG: hypothetical protein K2G44_04935 [Clostridia bacterium]|nr:hypothetical protein [Clostridia bacterium]
MKEQKTQKRRNQFPLRIYNEDVLITLEELYATNQFESMNDLLGRAVKIGAEEIYANFGKRRSLGKDEPTGENLKTKLDELSRHEKRTSLTVDDIFVMLSVLETMLSSLYNIEHARIRGEEVSAELMDVGYYAQLPKDFQLVKDELIAQMKKKNEDK